MHKSFLTVTIHRGSHEIGGSCVELRAGEDRLVLDLGVPLVDKDGNPFSDRVLRKDPETLVKDGTLPNIPGLYPHNDKDGTVLGVLLSHAHLDHYGFLRFIAPQIPVFAGRATHALLTASRPFLESTPVIQNPCVFQDGQAFQMDPFKVTPHLVDHSAFDAHAFLIEGEGHSVFYSGDFREGGWKFGTLDHMLARVQEPVDLLLLEGTTLGRDTEGGIATENQALDALVGHFKRFEGKPILVWCSGQNIDRINTIVGAATMVDRQVVVDLYVATVLRALDMFSLASGLKVWFANPTWSTLRENYHGYQVEPVIKEARVYPEEVHAMLSNAVVVVRPSMMDDLSKLRDLSSGLFVYSLWKEYAHRPENVEFFDFLSKRHFEVVPVHASGHANLQTLQKVVRHLRPKTLVPIHTFRPEGYRDAFPEAHVVVLEDRQELVL